MATLKIWMTRALVGIIGAILIGLISSALLPLPEDPLPRPEDFGAGASSVEHSATGLEREFPPVIEPVENPTTVEKVALGRLLFFDPILALENDISCATCHHPDYGFADGLPAAIGSGGTGAGPERKSGILLERNTPALWNVAYMRMLFWDGRADSLETQAIIPLTHLDEMGSTSHSEMVAELKDIPEYVNLFEIAFGPGEATLSFENILFALAAFQRTLISKDSPFDHYAAGDELALTPSQRRGLTLFRSAATRCFECHAAPTFSTATFRSIGVPDTPGRPPDLGRAAVADDGQVGAFRVPTLRNVVLTAPYMHNGAFETLEQVIDFYARGGGRTNSLQNIDPFVNGFELSAREREDLIAFMFALTDVSLQPTIPERVPSGLPVVPRLDNPAQALVETYNRPSTPAEQESRAPKTLQVQPHQTIQAVLDQALPGDTVEVPYGIYREGVVIDYNDITLLGIPNEDGEWPILDGEGKLTDGVIASGNGFEMGFFIVRNYIDNGVLVEGVSDVHLHDLITESTGTYGVYPVQSTNVLIERVRASGVNDAGIYAGQSELVTIRDSEAHGNVIGIEVENTVGAEVYSNHTYDNTLGIFIVLLPQLTSKVSLNSKVYDNLSEENNLPNFAPQGTTARLLPSGVGILLLASDRVEVYGNTIRGNHSAGLGVFNLTIGFPEDEIDVGSNPEHNWVHDNQITSNGSDPDPALEALGIPGSDILWDGSGTGNRFDQPGASSFPPILPASDWPEPVYRLYSRALNLMIRALT